MAKDWKDQLAEKTGEKNPGNNPVINNPDSSKSTGTNFTKIIFYVDKDKKKIDEKLVTEKAQEWAGKFLSGNDKKLTSAQLRRFYHDAKKLEEQIKEKGFDLFKPHIKLLDSKVAYAYRGGGSDQKVPKSFRDFIRVMIYSIEDQKDFEAFMLCFEAVVGYFYGDK